MARIALAHSLTTNFLKMKNSENKLIKGFGSVELEERLEMVHLSSLYEADSSGICKGGKEDPPTLDPWE